MYGGVDACSSGWIWVSLDQSLCVKAWGVEREFSAVMIQLKACNIVGVDIPIGLPWHQHPSRKCDADARTLLKPLRHSSVFSSPSRVVIDLWNQSHINFPNYNLAYYFYSNINFKEIGKKLSRQSFGIVPKIAEVDSYLLSNKMQAQRVLEIHPEVSFAILNGRKALGENKRTPPGQRDRVCLLSNNGVKYDSRGIDLQQLQLMNKQALGAETDDINDALVGALTVATMTGAPAVFDQRGLPMAIIGL